MCAYCVLTASQSSVWGAQRPVGALEKNAIGNGLVRLPGRVAPELCGSMGPWGWSDVIGPGLRREPAGRVQR